jgi:hypothetical protein
VVDDFLLGRCSMQLPPQVRCSTEPCRVLGFGIVDGSGLAPPLLVHSLSSRSTPGGIGTASAALLFSIVPTNVKSVGNST